MNIFLAIFFATSAFAMNEGQYSCTIHPEGGDRSPVELGFTLKDGDISCLEDDGEYCMTWFTYSPPEQNRFWLDGLYDGGFGYTKKGDWQISADSDGCNIGELTLYKDSNFTKGFITSEFRCSGPPTKRYAGEVFCRVR